MATVTNPRTNLLSGGSSSGTAIPSDPLQEARDLEALTQRVDSIGANLARGEEKAQATEQKVDQIQANVQSATRNVKHIKNVNDCLCKILLVCALIALVVSLVLMYRKPVLLN